MNRRKSIVQPSGGKHRSPFAPFKRSDHAREIQIPESAPESIDRPDTAVTTQDNTAEPVRITSESLDRGGPETVASSPGPQPAGPTANGTTLQETYVDPGLVNMHGNDVCEQVNTDRTTMANWSYSRRELILKVTPKSLRLSTK